MTSDQDPMLFGPGVVADTRSVGGQTPWARVRDRRSISLQIGAIAMHVDEKLYDAMVLWTRRRADWQERLSRALWLAILE